MQVSALKMHSWGLVTANKKAGSDLIKVMLVEMRFMSPEGVVHTADEITEQYETDEGEDTLKIITTNSVTAKWLNLNSNRTTAPDVRRNDDVMVFRLGETDQYYWMDFNIANVKRLETVVWAFSADPENPIADDLSNAYVVEFSSHNKTLTLQTSKANGEYCKYLFQFNLDEGFVVLEDDLGNHASMDSEQTVIKLKNALNSSVTLDKENIFVFAEKNIELKAEKNVKVDCKQLIMNATESATLTTPKFTVDGEMTVTKAVMMKMTLKVTGALEAASAKISGLIDAATGKFGSHGPH